MSCWRIHIHERVMSPFETQYEGEYWKKLLKCLTLWWSFVIIMPCGRICTNEGVISLLGTTKEGGGDGIVKNFKNLPQWLYNPAWADRSVIMFVSLLVKVMIFFFEHSSFLNWLHQNNLKNLDWGKKKTKNTISQLNSLKSGIIPWFSIDENVFNLFFFFVNFHMLPLWQFL